MELKVLESLAYTSAEPAVLLNLLGKLKKLGYWELSSPRRRLGASTSFTHKNSSKDKTEVQAVDGHYCFLFLTGTY